MIASPRREPHTPQKRVYCRIAMSLDKAGAHGPAARAGHGRRAHSEVVVARRYLARGFLDVAMRVFGRNVAQVTADDWTLLVDRLLERGRIAAAVEVCQTAGVPLPRQELLALGDRHLRRKDVDRAIHCYELADADHERWTELVNVLTRFPGRGLHAVAVAQRYLVPGDAPAASLRLAASA
jgi:hypothetical protein